MSYLLTGVKAGNSAEVTSTEARIAAILRKRARTHETTKLAEFDLELARLGYVSEVAKPEPKHEVAPSATPKGRQAPPKQTVAKRGPGRPPKVAK